MNDDPIDLRAVDSLELSIRSFTAEASVVGGIAEDAISALLSVAEEARAAGELALAYSVIERATDLIERLMVIYPAPPGT